VSNNRSKIWHRKNEFFLKEIVIAVDGSGKCYFSLEGGNYANPPKTWKCDFICKIFLKEDKQSIIDLKSMFVNGSVEEIRDLLVNLVDHCEDGHYSKPCHVDHAPEKWSVTNEFKGSSLQCCLVLVIVRFIYCELVLYTLRTLLNKMYQTRRSSNMIRKIKNDLTGLCFEITYGKLTTS